MDFAYTFINPEKGEALAQVKKLHIEILPIKQIDFKNTIQSSTHDNIVKLAERMLVLHKKLAVAKIPDEKTRIQRQIAATDKQIDKLVYNLYGLTDEEIEIVESGA